MNNVNKVGYSIHHHATKVKNIGKTRFESVSKKPYFCILNLCTMKIEYNNLYTHFVFTTFGRQDIIPDKNRIRIEKYITGIINNNESKLYEQFLKHYQDTLNKENKIGEE